MQHRVAPSEDRLAAAHEALRRDASFQFDRTGFTPPEAPAWLRWIADALHAIAPLLEWVFWIGLALLAALVLFAIWREILKLRRPKARPKAAGQAAAPWRPDAQAARDLLAEADALAARGLYAEASHLLLLRSVEDMERHRPRALRVSLTTREIAALQGLPENARTAFAAIGRVVERSLFGGAAVGRDDFADCRRAYEAFALPEGWAA